MSELVAYEEKNLKTIGTRPLRPDGVDKVTGRARYGADINLPGQLYGCVLRSPHAHARIKSIDISQAKALTGVKAVITSKDFEDMPSQVIPVGELVANFRDVTRNVMAREKVLYDGHPVAAVAATSESIAKKAINFIKVEYEILPHVIDVADAMKDDAPLLDEDQFTQGEIRVLGGDTTKEPVHDKPSNIAKRLTFVKGDIDSAFNEAHLVIERTFTTKPVHQGYIEPHAAVASYTEDGQVELYSCTQGHFTIRAQCAKLLSMDVSKIKVIPTELGGGFGGKNNVYLEPLAITLSKIARRPVKMVMSRNEVFRASGPSPAGRTYVKLGLNKKGKIIAADAQIDMQSGAFPGTPLGQATITCFTRYDIENVRVIGHDVISNRPKVAAYRAPGAPVAAFGVESVIDEAAKKLSIDPIDIRILNAAKEGTQTYYGVKFPRIGFEETLQKAKQHKNYQIPLKENQGRGVATGFWMNIGMDTTASLNVNDDGTIAVSVGTIDVAGGSRASLAMMVAEEFGIDSDKVRVTTGDTSQLGFNFVTAGSRGTFAGGIVSVLAARDAIEECKLRAAKTWNVKVEEVVWENGFARPASANVGPFEPLSLSDIARNATRTGGPIAGHCEKNVQGAGPSFGTQIVDVEVDKETGSVKILRHTIVQDAGKAIHPAYVEGQYQGGAVQGIGWALNEEYIYGEDGRLQNPGFLDYRVPVASDVPFIDVVIVEVPNPYHPYGVRGIGEVPIIPPTAAIANAINDAIGVRFETLPLSPPKVLAAIIGS
jgi:CO/xanthine dehydrogenase Mo-binding subunit